MPYFKRDNFTFINIYQSVTNSYTKIQIDTRNKHKDGRFCKREASSRQRQVFGDKIPSYMLLSKPIIAHSQASWLKRSYAVNFLTGKKKPLTTLVIRGFE